MIETKVINATSRAALSDRHMNASGLTSLDTRVLQDLREIAGADAPLFLAEVIDSYLEDVPPRLRAITQAVAAADASALQKSAHAFKSSSVSVGGMAVAQLCTTLEVMGRAGTTAGAQTLVEQLQVEVERLEANLQLEYPARQ